MKFSIIKIFKLKIRRYSAEGSALLIALIIMGILLTLSLGVSELLINSLRDSRGLLEKTRAWYAAETAMEHALLVIFTNPPGFETDAKADISLGAASYHYAISASSSKIPEKAPFEIRTDEDTYSQLHLNESVTIPLFSSPKPDDGAKKIRVDYYLAPDIKLRGGYIDNDLDILRWKIFGIAQDGTMEVINEFVPADKGNSAGSPTCIGTQPQCYNGAKYYQRRLAPDGVTEFHIIPEFPIETFLSQHTQNFLVLTNTVNVDLIAGSLSSKDKKKIATINYRVSEIENQPRLTLPIIKIFADGFAGETKQSLDLDIKRESFLPAFNYALYRTAD